MAVLAGCAVRAIPARGSRVNVCTVAEEEGALVYRTPGGMQLRPTTLAPSPLQSRKPELKARYRSFLRPGPQIAEAS